MSDIEESSNTASNIGSKILTLISNTGSEILKPIFSSIGNSLAITTVKLVGSQNYMSWATSVELWFMGQGYDDHLVKNAIDIALKNRSNWTKIDVQLCSLLWHSLDPKLLNIF